MKISLTIIDFLERAVGSEFFNPDDGIPDDTGYNAQGWPPLQEDIVVQNYFTRIRSIAKSSIEVHRGMLLAIQLSYDEGSEGEDVEILPMCVPSYDALFLKQSFYQEFHLSFETNEYQHEFIDGALKRHALSASGQ